MKSLLLIAVTLLVSAAHAQFESGHVKILEDQRFQDGAAFGNFRNQEDGIKYKEETNKQGIRTGFWEYPDENGKLQRVEFEAGPGIGFRIVNSNIASPTPIHTPSSSSDTQPRRPSSSSAPQPRRPSSSPQQRAPVHQAPVVLPRAQPQPRPQPQQFQPQPQQFQPRHQQIQPQHQQFQPLQQPQLPRIPLVQQTQPIPAQQPLQQPGPLNLFDYPADLQFFRDAGGHRFKFKAV